MSEIRDIGIDIRPPESDWDGSKNCPFYGNLRLRGQMFEGTVSRVNMMGTIVLERRKVRKIAKYERYEKRTSRLSAHVPSCIGNIKIGDIVKVMECKPLSKTVSFCVIEKEASE